MLHIIVRPVIHLGIETFQPPLNTLGEEFAREMRLHAMESNYLKTPDGWFVPLDVAMENMETLADYLNFEAKHYGEFEISGGFEIIAENGQSVGVSLGSMFRDAVNLANVVINLNDESAACRAFINADNFLDFFLNHETVRIVNGHAAKQIPSIEISVSIGELKMGMKEALRKLSEFAFLLESQLIRTFDEKFPIRNFRWQFSLE
jgi:hypothetical protein